MTDLRPKTEAYDPYSAYTTVKLSAGGISTPEVPIEDFIASCESVSGHLRGTKKTKVEKAEEITAQTVAVGQLRSFIERIERLEEEKKTVADDIKEVYAELKGSGFDSKAVRTIIRLRKKEEHERQEEAAMLQLYMDALGMV
ncbi:hypothetical protein ACI0FR_00037 [Paenochrobactrum sp. BZR 201-1]